MRRPPSESEFSASPGTRPATFTDTRPNPGPRSSRAIEP
jgi:hypothetical protein